MPKWLCSQRNRVFGRYATAGGSFFPVATVTPPALDTPARSRRRTRPLAFTGSPIAYPVAASRAFPHLEVKPPRRRSEPQLLRFADFRAEAVLTLLFRRRFSRARQAGDISCALAARRPSAFPPRGTLRVSGPPKSFASIYSNRRADLLFFFGSPGRAPLFRNIRVDALFSLPHTGRGEAPQGRLSPCSPCRYNP
jgi:hypothetical protein